MASEDINQLARKIWNYHQISQDIPDDVWSAYQKLIKMGFRKHLIKKD
jgi:flagellar biosynthesis protein FlhB